MIGTPEELSRYLWSLDKEKQYEIKEYKKKRSLNCNAYCWLLLGEIANEVGRTKEDIYRDYIKNKGIYRIITMNSEAVPTFTKIWSEKGLGWICETMETKIAGLIDVIAYYGTSSYNSKQMAGFVDYVVQEAKQLGIKTLEDYEIEKLIEEWEK